MIGLPPHNIRLSCCLLLQKRRKKTFAIILYKTVMNMSLLCNSVMMQRDYFMADLGDTRLRFVDDLILNQKSWMLFLLQPISTHIMRKKDRSYDLLP